MANETRMFGCYEQATRLDYFERCFLTIYLQALLFMYLLVIIFIMDSYIYAGCLMNIRSIFKVLIFYSIPIYF